MVNKNNDSEIQDDSEITYDEQDTTDTELAEDERTAEQKLKDLRKKVADAEEAKRELHEELQRTKADFLNARKRLEDERLLDRKRALIGHIEKLLPLADSFYLARYDKEAWEKGDEKWRKGVEGIHQQLLGILNSYGVRSYDPTGSEFDPQKHEALSSVSVKNKEEHHRVLTVMQLGYELFDNDTTTIIRPARVTVGEYSEGV